MSPPLETVFLALSELTKKRGLLADDQIPKLLDLAKGGSVTDVDSLRSWVKSTPHLASGLRRELLRSLKAPRHRQMGSYHIIGHLADGGMGDVWLAADGHGRLAVVKTLLNELSSDTEFLLRFEREARITAQFTSRYLVRCLEHGQSEDGAMYIALEYVPGGDLHNLVCHRQYLSEEEALRITQHIALGLDDAADARLVHRDIKPENILISNEGDAKLVDFGLARSTSSDRTVLTMAGSTLGTPDYMSPEQIYGEDDLDVRSDLYALGAVLFFSLAGHPPFEGDNIEVMKQHISSRLPNIRRLNRSVGRTTQAIIEKCMEKEPVRRFQRPKELAKAVADALDNLGHDMHDSSLHGLKASDILPPVILDDEDSLPVDIDDALAMEAGEGLPLPTPGDMSGHPTGELVIPGQDWIALHAVDAPTGHVIHCFGRDSLIIGKMRAEPVDICLRSYPKQQYEKVNGRISRQHMQLRHDPLTETFRLTDLGSTNGTVLDGQPLAAKQPMPLSPGITHRVSVPKSMAVTMRGAGTGLDGSGPGGVVINRIDNSPEISYLMVTGILSIGMGGDLPISGPANQSAIELAWDGEGFCWRARGTEDWFAVEVGEIIGTPGFTWSVVIGSYDHFA